MRTWKKLLVAGAAAAAIAVPAVAVAAPAAGDAASPRTAGAVASDRAAILRTRIQLALERRKLRFDRAGNTLQRHITRLGVLAGKVGAKGGDVTSVKDLLSQAQAKFDSAKATEQQAVQQFNAVPDATDKRAAFQSAKSTAAQAVAQLREARSLTQQAARELRGVVDGLRSGSGSAAQ